MDTKDKGQAGWCGEGVQDDRADRNRRMGFAGGVGLCEGPGLRGVTQGWPWGMLPWKKGRIDGVKAVLLEEEEAQREKGMKNSETSKI